MKKFVLAAAGVAGAVVVAAQVVGAAPGPAFTNFSISSKPGTVCPGSSDCTNNAAEPAIRSDPAGNFFGSSENGLGGGTVAVRSTDGGQSWETAELRTPAYPMAHTRFGLHWNWDGKECVLMSRCTDELGTVQPTRADIAKYWNEPVDKVRVRGADNSVQEAIAPQRSHHRFLMPGRPAISAKRPSNPAAGLNL